MKKKYKIAFFDIDGTLYDYKTRRFIQSGLDEIKKFQSSGGKIYLSTARCYSITKEFGLFDLGIRWDGLILFSGGLIIAERKIIKKHLMKPSLIKEVDRFATSLGATCEILGIRSRYITSKASEYAKEYNSYFPDKMARVKKYQGEEANGILLYAPKNMDEAIKKKFPNITYKRFLPNGVEISTDIERNKGKAVKDVLDFYGFEKEDAVAFGDGLSDIEMKDYVDSIVIVGNGNEDAKKMANHVCLSIEKDGLAKIMEEIIDFA